MDDSTSKRCTKCGEIKSLTDFHLDRRAKGGRRAECKTCKNAREFAKWVVQRDAERDEKRRRRAEESAGAVKRCVRCQQELPLLEFYKLKKSPDGRHAKCRTCFLENRARRRAMTDEDKRREVVALATRESKRCGNCKQELPREQFNATGRSRDGMKSMCKPCERAWHAGHYANNRESILERHRQTYLANQERYLEARKAFRESMATSQDADAVAWRERRRERGRTYYAANPEKFAAIRQRNIESGAHAAYIAEWRRRNREHYLEWTRMWRSKNGERIRQRARERYAENAEVEAAKARAWRANNAEELREYWRARREAQPERLADQRNRRRARILGTSTGPVDLKALWTGLCGICAEPIDEDARFPEPLSRSVDHIVPLALGGTHTQDNLQWAHLFCNVSKGARRLD